MDVRVAHNVDIGTGRHVQHPLLVFVADRHHRVRRAVKRCLDAAHLSRPGHRDGSAHSLAAYARRRADPRRRLRLYALQHVQSNGVHVGALHHNLGTMARSAMRVQQVSRGGLIDGAATEPQRQEDHIGVKGLKRVLVLLDGICRVIVQLLLHLVDLHAPKNLLCHGIHVAHVGMPRSNRPSHYHVTKHAQ